MNCMDVILKPLVAGIVRRESARPKVCTRKVRTSAAQVSRKVCVHD